VEAACSHGSWGVAEPRGDDALPFRRRASRFLSAARRCAAGAGYKGQRPEAPPEVRAAAPRIRELLRAMGVAEVCAPGVEADDVIGTLAVRGVAVRSRPQTGAQSKRAEL
jgi:hypothetical protein